MTLNLKLNFHQIDTVLRMHLITAQAWRQDSMTGGAEINFWGAREHEKFIYVNSKRARGHENFIGVWIKRKRGRPKKKVFSTNNSTNSGCRLKILAIFHEFFSDDQKKKFFVPKVS